MVVMVVMFVAFAMLVLAMLGMKEVQRPVDETTPSSAAYRVEQTRSPARSRLRDGT